MPPAGHGSKRFSPALARSHQFVFVGLLLTAFGSSSYPLSPNDSRCCYGLAADDDRVHVDGGGDNRGAPTKRQVWQGTRGNLAAHSIVSERERAASGVENN